jgi:hypothetical protein
MEEEGRHEQMNEEGSGTRKAIEEGLGMCGGKKKCVVSKRIWFWQKHFRSSLFFS